MGMFEKVFGSAAEVGQGKGKAGEEAFRGAESPRRTVGEKELELGDVSGRTLDRNRAEQVYAGAASNMESAIEREAKMAKLRDDIAFLESELGRYVGIMSQARSNNELSAVKEMMGTIDYTKKKKAALEAELESLAG